MTVSPQFKINLSTFQKRNAPLASLLEKHVVEADRFALDVTKEDNNTLCYSHTNGDEIVSTYVHSRYRPTVEANRFAEHQYRTGTMVVYGIGLAYHIVALCRRLQPKQRLIVYDANLDLWKLAFMYGELESILNLPELTFAHFPVEQQMIETLEEHIRVGHSLVVHRPSLNCLSDDMADLRLYLTNYLMPGNNELRQRSAAENHHANLQQVYLPISQLYGCYQGGTIFIVSSGPSLNFHADTLSQAALHGVIICVGSALKPLLQMGVTPNYVILMDAMSGLVNQLKGCEHLGVPMLFSNFTCADAVGNYHGPKYMYICEPIANINSLDMIDCGGSVANAAVSIALKMGANRICFIGQDLCFPHNKHHAAGTWLGDSIKVKTGGNYLRVQNIQGEYVSTQYKLLNYLKWFEQAIEDHSDVEFFNISEHGLPIAGAQQISGHFGRDALQFIFRLS